MRVFQNGSVYQAYLPRLYRLSDGQTTFEQRRETFVDDRFDASHVLHPADEHASKFFFTVGSEPKMQRAWARQAGLSERAKLDDILLAQIEEHRAEVFYNTDPTQFDDSFLARLPSSVKKTIAWWAAPAGSYKFLKHDIIVSNFTGLQKGFEEKGARTGYFFPAHDPEMDRAAAQNDRPVDVLFVGSYSRHHLRRAEMLEALVSMDGDHKVALYLNVSRATRFAEMPFGFFGPLKHLRRPAAIRKLAQPPVFGRSLYQALSSAKIVVNSAIDMAGNERGNMRVWEATGCRAALVTDSGIYPPKMSAGVNFATYDSLDSMVATIEHLLKNPGERVAMARSGNEMIRAEFSKQRQWDAFCKLASQ